MLTDGFLRGRRGVDLEQAERRLLEDQIAEVRVLDARYTLVRANEPLAQSTLLIAGFMCRYIDDREGHRQLVAIHVPGDFVDLHGYPLKRLEHDVATISAATVAIIQHDSLDVLTRDHPALARKLWFSTLLDAAIHRAWLFRLGRLDAAGRVAHFICETNARLAPLGLSDGRRFPLPLTQADLGEACGLTSVHVNRVMRQLREDGLCRFRSHVVEILDLPRLALRGQFDPTYLYLDASA